jgi:mono/diheme cytochrome c family protein
MKKLMNFIFVTVMLTGISSITISFIDKQQKASVPDEYKTMKNPVKSNTQNLDDAKEAYNKHCASCHGKKGLGDGPKARTIDTSCGDFSTAKFQSQTDGELFYWTKFGRGVMPAYKGKVSDEDIWGMVNYMRTFKK